MSNNLYWVTVPMAGPPVHFDSLYALGYAIASMNDHETVQLMLAESVRQSIDMDGDDRVETARWMSNLLIAYMAAAVKLAGSSRDALEAEWQQVTSAALHTADYAGGDPDSLVHHYHAACDLFASVLGDIDFNQSGDILKEAMGLALAWLLLNLADRVDA